MARTSIDFPNAAKGRKRDFDESIISTGLVEIAGPDTTGPKHGGSPGFSFPNPVTLEITPLFD